jgi:hypothetical protein
MIFGRSKRQRRKKVFLLRNSAILCNCDLMRAGDESGRERRKQQCALQGEPERWRKREREVVEREESKRARSKFFFSSPLSLFFSFTLRFHPSSSSSRSCFPVPYPFGLFSPLPLARQGFGQSETSSLFLLSSKSDQKSETRRERTREAKRARGIRVCAPSLHRLPSSSQSSFSLAHAPSTLTSASSWLRRTRSRSGWAS